MSLRAPAIGIDLGTTQSCVSVFRNKKLEVIANDAGSRLTPSVVAFTDTELYVGKAAINQTEQDPASMIHDAKRIIGRRFEDSELQEDIKRWPFGVIDHEGCPKIQITTESGYKNFFPEEISAFVLRKMKETAEAFLGQTVTSAVITVPAYFNDHQRRATKDAGIIAGLNVLRIINEPTASAIAYGFAEKSEKKKVVLVFDLGGGTFDVSIVSIVEGKLKVKATSGDTHLGGEDFNNRLIDYVIEECKKIHGIDVSGNKRTLRRLRNECEEAKKTLSTNTHANIEVLFGGDDFLFEVSRVCFEELNKDLFQKTIDCVENVLRDSGINKKALDEVILVGGSTRIPKIQEMLRDFFEGKELNQTVNPDEAVACGAAIHAAMLNNDSSNAGFDIKLVDVTPLSLGTAVGLNHRMSVVIARNSIIPVKRTQRFVTMHDNQTSVKFAVYEGERVFVKDNNWLGEFFLLNFKASPARTEQFDATFSIDDDGILNVSAVDVRSGNKKDITITDDGRLSKATIERAIKDATKYRSAEHKKVMRNNIKLQLEGYCISMKNFLTSGTGSKTISEADRKLVLARLEQVSSWVKANKALEPEQYQNRFEETKKFCDSIVDKNQDFRAPAACAPGAIVRASSRPENSECSIC